ncbi:MAG: hypothetical protein Kow0069_11020 [Promethearchaeota archaeon]
MELANDLADKLLSIAEELSFPRLVGTEGEKRAKQLIRERMRRLETTFDEETVRWSTAPWKVVLPALCVAGLAGALFTLFLAFHFPQFTFTGLLASALAIGVPAWALLSGKAYWIGADDNPPSTNFVARVPPAGQASARVVFTAHYDTKSQSVPAAARVLLIGLAGGSLLLFFAFTLVVQFSSVVPGWRGSLAWSQAGAGVAFFPLAVGALGTASVRLGNNSPGALDNASGVAVCFGLLDFFKECPLEHTEVVVAFLTGEELGLYGARAFVERHADELAEVDSVNLNFDGVKAPLRYLARLGSVNVKSPDHRPFFDALLKAAEEADVSLQAVRIPFGAWTDSLPFVKAGFSSTTIISLGGGGRVHRRGDVPERLDRAALALATRLGVQFARVVDQTWPTEERDDGGEVKRRCARGPRTA